MTEEDLAFEAFGVTVTVEVRHRCSSMSCGAAGLADGARNLLPPGADVLTEPTAGGATVRVECHGGSLEVTDDNDGVRSFDALAPCLHAVDQAIRSVVAVGAPGLVFVHAGVVAVDDRAIVLPGKSMAGKTTLVAALVGAGATYLSDEYAVFDADGLVHPYARRLSVRGTQGRREIPVTELGGVAATGATPVALVAALEYQPDTRWAVTSVDQAGCAVALVRNAVAAQSRTVEVLGVAALVARTTACISGTRGEAAEAVAHLVDLTRGAVNR